LSIIQGKSSKLKAGSASVFTQNKGVLSLLVEESIAVVSGVGGVGASGVGGDSGVGANAGVESAPVEAGVGVGGGEVLGRGHSDEGEDENGLRKEKYNYEYHL